MSTVVSLMAGVNTALSEQAQQMKQLEARIASSTGSQSQQPQVIHEVPGAIIRPAQESQQPPSRWTHEQMAGAAAAGAVAAGTVLGFLLASLFAPR